MDSYAVLSALSDGGFGFHKQDDFIKAGSYSLNALHKIRFNPNLGSLTWCAAGGESGLLILLPLTRACATIADLHYKEENKH
ncbi:unnamed protein product [Didymodactylos carnosus]|uniref:Uncharacterized protein n=1 Tax=Didymodactylos carnosus TaxID=1234261 RepID=A0A816BZ69_9BILA|nr:unnamed protein product [Didymodactylos carnosus]CAF4504448.1 unnamed protein product [Didymodactylos carnosus]